MNHTTQTIQELTEQFSREAKGPGPLWASAAQDIINTLKQNSPADAATCLTNKAWQCRTMAISSFYAGAAKTLKAALRKDQRANAKQEQAR